MARWSAAKEGRILASLFENGLADPKFDKAADIDPIKDLKDEFKSFTAVQFRTNYRKTAGKWLGGKAMEGARRRTFLSTQKIKEGLGKEEQVDTADIEEAHNDTDIEEEDDEEDIYPEEVENKTVYCTSGFQEERTMPTITKSTPKFKPDEVQYCPRYTSHIYPAKNHWREQIIIETPYCFTGEEGSFEVGIEENDTQFVFKIPPNEVFIDPHSLHAYQAAVYNRNFGDDSAKALAFKESTKEKKGKWATFRHDLKFKATKSDDLGVIPWIDFAVLESDGVKTAVLIIELKSVEPIEKDIVPKNVSKGLTMNTFTSPTKMKGVDFASGSTAQQALFLEEMMRRGLKLTDLANAAKRGGLDVDAMMEDGNETEYEDCFQQKKQRSE